METFIQALFAFCCILINEIGNLFHLSYQAINVYAFCYIEPIFTGCMILFAILSICKIRINIIGKIFFWFVLSIIGILFFIAFCRVLIIIMGIIQGTFEYTTILNTIEQDSFILQKFQDTVNWFQKYSKMFHVSYYMLNILVYVIIMPILCIISYLILNRRMKCLVQ